MHGREKSDRCVVPMKPANKAERSAAEWVEGRHLVEGSIGPGTHAPDTGPGWRVATTGTISVRNCMGCPNPERRSGITRDRSPVRESRTPGSVRGARSNARPYRDRTAVLGGHVEQCGDCGHQRIWYNSCRNKSCPKCQGLARAQWLDDRQAELLEVPYFHVVFTVPEEIEAIAF